MTGRASFQIADGEHTSAKSLPERGPLSIALQAYWNGLRNGSEMPRHSQVNPSKIPRAMLTGIAIWDIENESVRYRFAGTRFREVAGYEPHGRSAGTRVSVSDREYVRKTMLELKQRPFGTWNVQEFNFQDAPPVLSHITTFPLRDGEKTWPYMTLGLLECDIPIGYRGREMIGVTPIIRQLIDVGFGVPDLGLS